MLDTPNNLEPEAIVDLRALMAEVEQEGVPPLLTALAEKLSDALAAQTPDELKPA